MRGAFQALSSEKEYRYWFDPFWARAEPYRSRVQPGASVELKIHLRNFLSREQAYRVEIHTPPGLRADPPVIDTRLKSSSRREFTFRITAAPDAKPGVHLLALDITRDSHRHGELFDAIIEVAP